MSSLTEEEVRQWQQGGAVVVQLPEDVVAPALAYLDEHMTKEGVGSPTDFGSGGKYEFPCGIEPLDDLVLSPWLFGAAEQLLGTSDLRLLQADLWPKVGVPSSDHDEQANTDQRMHMDYGNNTLLHPPPWDSPDAVAAIVYYDDSAVTAGGTAYVLREGDDDEAYRPPYVRMPGQGGLPFVNDRKHAEAYFAGHAPDIHAMRQTLYAREQKVAFKPGTVLFYRHDIWHRGTPLNPGALRRVSNVAWRRADAEGLTNWNQGWARNMYYGEVEALIARSSPAQRALLGFPLPGHPYWDRPGMLENVTARYAHYGFDPTPYAKQRVLDGPA